MQRGDYLGKIAAKFGVRVKQIREWNSLSSDRIKVGLNLKIYPEKNIKEVDEITPPAQNTVTEQFPQERTEQELSKNTSVAFIENAKGYYKDGKLRDVGNYRDNLKTGEWKYYHPNGELLYIGEFVNGKETGPWKFYHDNGKLESEGAYNGGLKSGLWTSYHSNGNLKSVGEFKKGEITGYWKYYHENGQIASEGNYQDLKRTGKWLIYDEEGALQTTKYY